MIVKLSEFAITTVLVLALAVLFYISITKGDKL